MSKRQPMFTRLPDEIVKRTAVCRIHRDFAHWGPSVIGGFGDNFVGGDFRYADLDAPLRYTRPIPGFWST